MNLARKTWILARRNRELLGRSIGKMMIKLINHGIFANGLARSLKTTEKMVGKPKKNNGNLMEHARKPMQHPQISWQKNLHDHFLKRP